MASMNSILPRLTPLALLLLSLGACSTPPMAQRSTASAPESAPPAPAAAPAPASGIVEFYNSPEDVPYAYREINTVTVVGWGRDHDEMVRELKDHARSLGADGVILLQSQDTEECGLDYSNSACTRDSVLMRGIAIINDETDDAEVDPKKETADTAGSRNGSP